MFVARLTTPVNIRALNGTDATCRCFTPMTRSNTHYDESREPLEAVVEEAIETSDNGEVSLKSILRAWDDRSYGPLFILLGAFAGTPLAVVPGAAAVVGIFISILALQMMVGAAHPWLPDFALKQSVKESSLKNMRDKLSPVLSFIDHLITERLQWAAGEVMRRAAAAIVFVLGIVMIPFDAVPFAVAAPAWTVALFGVAITARDGLIMLAALAACAAVAAAGFMVL